MEFNIPVPWGHIAGKSYGSWSGVPVLAIHDWNDNSGSFEAIGPLVSKGIFLVVVDLPGHGRSSHLPLGIPYHRVDFASIIKRIADHQRWKKFSLLGHGEGAELVVLFTAAFSNMVSNLVLIDSLKPSSISFVDRAKDLAAEIDEQVEFDEKYQKNSKAPPTVSYEDGIQAQIDSSKGELSETTAKHIFERGAKLGEGQWTSTSDIRISCPDTLRFSNEQVMNLIEALKDIRVLFVRTKAMPSEQDDILTKAAIEKYRKICASFTQVEVKGGHYAHLTHPHDVLEVMEDFLLQ